MHWGAGKSMDIHCRKLLCYFTVIRRRSVVIERQQAQELHAAVFQPCHLLQQFFFIASFIKIADENQYGLFRF